MTTLTAMPKYETYKYSGIEWIGDIPAQWDIKRIKYVFSEVNTKSLDGSGELLSVSQYTGVTKRADGFSDNEYITNAESLSGYKEVKKGDLVSNIMLAWNGSLAFSSFDGITSPAYSVYRLRNVGQERYFHYLLRTEIYKAEYKRKSTGVVDSRLRLYTEDFFDVWAVLPSDNEKTAIANFLDEKTAKIDEAIAIKEKQIELLKERKQIIIQQAVTQGLDPTVPMKDSDVEWIGQIPAHWEVKKIKYFFDILPGYAFKSELYSTNSSDLKLLRGINVSPDRIKWDEVAYWPKEKVAGLESFFLKEGDLVIAMDRPWVSTGIRIAEISESDLPCLLLQRVGRIRGINHFSTKYIKLLLSTKLFLSYFEPMLTGISVPHISTEQISGFCCPIPPENEQNNILKHINIESERFEKIIYSLNIEIEKLREYKTTLINSAVTGKIKVV